jgi:hypothetical protein
MPSKWAVLVVHGVGDTRPGATVDSFLPALAAARAGTVHPDGRRDVLWLHPDGYATPAVPPEEAPPEADSVFPVHIRSAAVTAGADEPEQAVIAEVYWADLSRIREGVFHSILALISTIFLVRFISDQAAVMPLEPTTARANRARAAARWLRAALYLSAWLLNGPIAALCLLLACVLAVDNVLLPYLGFQPISPVAHEMVFMSVGLAAGLVGGIAWFYGRRANWGSTWMRVWGALALTGLIFAGVVAVHEQLAPSAQDGAVRAVAAWVGTTTTQAPEGANPARAAGPVPPQLHGPTFLLAGIRSIFVLICIVVLLALFPWGFGLWQAPKEWRPAFGASYATALLQIALWMLIIPGLALSAIATLVKDPPLREHLGRLFGRIEGEFALFLVVAMILGGLAVAVWVSRSRWVKRYPGGYPFPQPPPDIARLIVHVLIIGSLIVLNASVCVLAMVSAFVDIRPDLIPATWAAAIAAPLFALVLGYFGTGLRNALHIITDIINHFYRRRERFPYPWGPEDRPGVPDFEIQQKIEARFRAVLKALLKDPHVTRLSVVSHSQGTIIAVDVFSLSSMTRVYKDWLTGRLDQVGKLNLITMGSPLTHLYQHYFPDRYDPLASPAWADLRDTLARWVNIYRIDDYIGTFVEVPAQGWPAPNRPIHAGGHTEYWDQPAVFQAVCAREPHSLPG